MLPKKRERRKQADILKEKPVLFYNQVFVYGKIKPNSRENLCIGNNQKVH